MPVLERIDEGLWSSTRALRFYGVETGTRMTIVRLSSGGLFIHSPAPLSAALRDEVDALGPVVAIASPSLFHHLAAGEWKAAYPDALLACCPGLENKRSDLAWDQVLSDTPDPIWADDLDQVFFGARTMENEVVFFHAATRTMITCDAVFNLSQHPSRFTRFVAFVLANRKPGATWLEHVMIRRRKDAREQVGRMLAWKPERILIAHGPSIERDGEKVLRDAYAWL